MALTSQNFCQVEVEKNGNWFSGNFVPAGVCVCVRERVCVLGGGGQVFWWISPGFWCIYSLGFWGGGWEYCLEVVVLFVWFSSSIVSVLCGVCLCCWGRQQAVVVLMFEWWSCLSGVDV